MIEIRTLNLTINIADIIAIIALIIVALLVIITLYLIFKSPFRYPYFNHNFDISGKRKPQIDDLIDHFLIMEGFDTILQHKEKIKIWKKECRSQIDRSPIKKYREKQYKKCLDDNHAFRFRLQRQQTRYQQINYIKYPYTVIQSIATFTYSYSYLFDRFKRLESIDFKCTLKEYNDSNQRRLMTPKLKQSIIDRDNYTCQLCGKYMPDTVGLHVDHIIPVSKGGKSIPSNLQVLCSKCNGKKSNK